MSMKMSNFHYNYCHQTSFHCSNVTFVFVMGYQILHIYVEVVICVAKVTDDVVKDNNIATVEDLTVT